MLDWLFDRRELRELRAEVQRRRASYVERETRIHMLRKENQQQRVLIEALRDVNKSLDERLIAMERDG
jgi:CHAD domain-containing protein